MAKILKWKGMKGDNMLIFAIVVLCFMILFLYSACVVSSRCSREEEKQDFQK